MDGRRRGVSGFLPWTAPCGVGSGCFHRHRTTSAYRREKSRLGHVVEEASHQSTLLVTNDEDLLSAARHHSFSYDLVGLSSENSTGMIIRLLRCGALPDEFVEACLTAEYANLDEMRSRGMSAAKYERKRRRLAWAGQQLSLSRYDNEWLPDRSGR